MISRRNSTNGNGEQTNRQVLTHSRISAAPTPSSVPQTGPNNSSWIQMHQTLLSVSLSVKNSMMDDTQLHFTPVLSSPQKRTTMFTTKKWQPSFMDSNVADHISLVPTI